MIELKSRLAAVLLLAACCSPCIAIPQPASALQFAAKAAEDERLPGSISPDDPKQIAELVDRFADKRAMFIGEVHDQLRHHQNQLRIIQAMYARYPDLAIGVEYFQQPFQRYLDDYIAGRIDEREMLVKTEYFKRWQIDYRLLRPIFAFAREKHIPVLALNVPDEIHNKVFRWGMKSLTPEDRAQIPSYIEPASEHYLNRLQAIYGMHPPRNEFANFIDGVLLWDEAMADTAAHYLNAHPKSRIIMLAGMVHVMYGDGIPERLDRQLGGNQSIVTLNGNNFSSYPGVADYQITTGESQLLSKPGKLGITIVDGPAMNGMAGVRVTEFAPDSAAQDTGIEIGDRIVALDGVNVGSIPEVKSLMFDKLPGERVSVTIQRNMPNEASHEVKVDVVLR